MGGLEQRAAWLYYRVSDDDQERGVSLDVQAADCRRLAAHKGWVIAGESTDVLTGKRPDRRGYQEALAAVRAGRANLVLVWRLDRFGRNLRESIGTCADFDELGVEVHSVREGHLPPFVRSILLSLAEEESRRIGERVYAAQHFLASRGWWLGKTPIGYRAVKAAGEDGKEHLTLEADPETAPIVVAAFERYATGDYSLGKLVRWINGLPPHERGHRLHERSVVNRMLRNPVYKGVARWNVRKNINNQRLRIKPADQWLEVPARWPGIVDEATWAKVQRVMDAQTVVPRQASGTRLLTGFLRCPVCGARMFGKGCTKKAKALNRPTQYRCGAAIRTETCRTVVAGGPVDRVVRETVRAILAPLSDPAVIAAARQQWAQLRRGPQDASARRLRELEGQRDRAAAVLKKAAYKLVADELDAEGYAAIREEQQAIVSAAESEIRSLERKITQTVELPAFDQALAEVGGWATIFERSDVAGQRRVLEHLLQTAVPRRVSWGKYDVEMALTALGEALRAAALAVRPAA